MSVSSEITRIQNGVTTQSSLISQIRTALINKTSTSIAAITANSLSNNTTSLQTILSSINALNEYPLTSYTIDDFEEEQNASRNGAVVTISGSSENSLALTVNSTKSYVIAYNSVNCGLIGLAGDGSWSQVFDYDDEGENILAVSGAGYLYFYPIDTTEPSYEIHNLNIVEIDESIGGSSVTIESNKDVTPTTSQQVITPSSGYDAMAQVTVAAIQTETKTATANGTVTPTSGKYLSSVTVNVPSATIESNKDVTPTTSQQVITPSSGYDAMAKVTVAAVVGQTYYTGNTAPLASLGNDGDLYFEEV